MVRAMRGHWQLICTTLATGKATRFPARFLEVYGGAVIAVKNPEETRA